LKPQRPNGNSNNNNNNTDQVNDKNETAVDNESTLSSSTYSSSSSSIWHCPADDFRLWCLGLSGSYRGPATFSESRIVQAQTVRHKIVRFLLDGEAWVLHDHNNNKNHNYESYSKRRCTNNERDLLITVQQAKIKGLVALKNDLDGSTFLSELMGIIESCNAYMGKKHVPNEPVEVVRSALNDVRDLLRLVGFTCKTVDAGLGVVVDDDEREESCGLSSSSMLSAQDTSSLVQTLIDFRSAVRRIALLHDPNQDNIAVDGRKELLRLSDEIRDKTLPEIGIQIMDGREGTQDNWKWCQPSKEIPHHVGPTTKEQQQEPIAMTDVHSVALSEFFKVGQYDGMFSEFTDQGIPTHHADRTEVSKRLLKKLLKKRQAHQKRLEGNHNNNDREPSSL
jgi:hypothetical protein